MHPCPAYKCRGWDGNPTLTDQPMCDHHRAKVRDALTGLPVVYVQLEDAMPAGSGVVDDGRTGAVKASSAPLPINPQARSLQDDMLAVTLEAEIATRRKARLSPRRLPHPYHPHGVELTTLTRRSELLAKHHESMLAADAHYGIEVLRITHAARSLLGYTRLVHRLDVPCPYCDTIAVVRDDGSSWVRCEDCGATFDEQHYGLLVRMVADQLPAQAARKAHAHLTSTREGYGW
jgi:ribosomal protein L37AE/L43A